jgi:hypothetical protein
MEIAIARLEMVDHAEVDIAVIGVGEASVPGDDQRGDLARAPGADAERVAAHPVSCVP